MGVRLKWQRDVLGGRGAPGYGTGGTLIQDPRVVLARMLRGRLKPIRIAPTIILDGGGRHIATITVDPVTGARTRTEVPPEKANGS